MRDVDPGPGPWHDRGEPRVPPLTALALLYAGGELDEDEAAAFEKRLGEDQAAREALAQAVNLARSLAGHKPPDPAYRAEVRRRLRPPGFWGRLLAPRLYPGHPALWTGIGAATAVLLTVAVLHAPASRGRREPTPVPVAVERPEPAAVPRPADSASTAEVAKVWAALHNSEHLARAREEEVRRRDRAEDRPARLHVQHH